jgi:hypothetical protein
MRHQHFHPSPLTLKTPAAAWQAARDPFRFLPLKPVQYRALLTRLVDDLAALTDEAPRQGGISKAGSY